MVKQYNSKFRVGQGGIKVIAPIDPIPPVTLEEGVDQLVLVDTTNSGTVTIILQRADGSGGKRLCIKKIGGTGNVVITPAGSQTIDGQSSVTLVSVNEAVDIISDNENWLKAVVAGGLQLIQTVVADNQDDTLDFNLPTPFTGEDGSMLVLVFDIVWLGADNYPMRINQTGGGNYFQDGRRIIGGVETILDLNSQQFFNMASNSLITANGDILHLICYIQIQNNRVGITNFANGVTVNGNEFTTGKLDQDISSITQLSFEGNADFDIGSRFSLYKLTR